MNNIDEIIETIQLALTQVEWEYPMDYAAAFDAGIRALEMQKELAKYSGYDICEWDEFEHHAERVEDFLIDEAKGEE